MKTLALMIIFVLHSSGVWTYLPGVSKNRIAQTASNISAGEQEKLRAELFLSVNDALELPIQTAHTPLELGASSAIAIDRSTATVLYSKQPNARRPIASVTKLITALVILSRHSPSEIVTIPTLPDYAQEAETIGLVKGDSFTIEQLLEAALVPSANDAADALALIDAGSIRKFAARMNLKMIEWGIDDTRFSSASGLQDTQNYASAASLAKIAGLTMINPTLADLVARTSTKISSKQGRSYNLTSTNELLASGQFYGIKTGYTLAAGECFVGITRVRGHEVITVVLGADNRFGATSTLINWIGQNWQWL